MSTTPSAPGHKYSAQEWDEIRKAFQHSIMKETALSSLAQDLDTQQWPRTGPEETPAKYLDFSFEELTMMPEFAAQPELIDRLITILKETLSFDNPFGDMVAHTAAEEAKENPLLKNLTKLEIPGDFPMELSMLSAQVKEFCVLEKLATLADFANFAQNMPSSVIVGGDFRSLLNAVAHVNEEALAGFLPFRVGSKGLHLPEALAQTIGALPPEQVLALGKKFGGKLTPSEAERAGTVDKGELATVEATLRARATQYAQFFKVELDELATAVRQGSSIERNLVVLDDPLKEAIAAALLEPMVKQLVGKMAPGEAAAAPEKKGGFFGGLFRLFRK